LAEHNNSSAFFSKSNSTARIFFFVASTEDAGRHTFWTRNPAFGAVPRAGSGPNVAYTLRFDADSSSGSDPG